MPYKVLGFHLEYSESGIQTISKYHNILDKVIPNWIKVKADGSLKITKGNNILHTCLKKNKITPMVQNFNLNSNISNELINNEVAIRKFINNIITYLNKMGYKEICLDIEGVKSGYKNSFTQLIRKTAEFLHDKGYYLSVAIPAKSENNQDSTWSGAYDYSLLGEIVDKVIIMAYDFHWPGGPPGSIAPLSWVQDVIDFAIIEIPLEKLYFGFGLYGYDWTVNNDKNARGLVYRQIEDIRKKYSGKIEWDQDSQSPYLRYKKEGNEHEIWFENKRSIEKKIKLLSEFQLKGLVFWRLGQEDPDIWSLFI